MYLHQDHIQFAHSGLQQTPSGLHRMSSQIPNHIHQIFDGDNDEQIRMMYAKKDNILTLCTPS